MNRVDWAMIFRALDERKLARTQISPLERIQRLTAEQATMLLIESITHEQNHPQQ
jgi:hypothetical protein